MSTRVPDKLTDKERFTYVRRVLRAPRQHFFYNNSKNVNRVVDGLTIGGMFITKHEALVDPAIKKMPGTQNKHHGRKPRSYKHKRDIVKNSRRKNRSK